MPEKKESTHKQIMEEIKGARKIPPYTISPEQIDYLIAVVDRIEAFVNNLKIMLEKRKTKKNTNCNTKHES